MRSVKLVICYSLATYIYNPNSLQIPSQFDCDAGSFAKANRSCTKRDLHSISEEDLALRFPMLNEFEKKQAIVILAAKGSSRAYPIADETVGAFTTPCLVSLCRELECRTMVWQSAFYELRTREKAIVIPYLRELCSPSEPRRRFFVYELCGAAHWDDFAGWAICDFLMNTEDVIVIANCPPRRLAVYAQEYLQNLGFVHRPFNY